MSDLAPFVAAAIRDRVVEDMAKEIGDLKKQKKEELAPWLVVIHGPPDDDEEPVVYAWARISMKEVLTQTLSRENSTIQNDRTAYVEVKSFKHTGHKLRLEDFLSCSVRIICNRSYHVYFDDDVANIGRGCGITEKENEGKGVAKDFWFQWWYFSRGGDQNKDVVEGFEVAMPIAPENQDRVTDELVADVSLLRDNVLDFADEVAGDNAPIRFLNMTLDAQGLVSLLNGDDGSDADDTEESVDNDDDAMSVED